jgi:hypothetical protein
MKYLKAYKIFEAKTPKVSHGFTGTLTQDQITWMDSIIDKQERGYWEYNPKTNRVDVQGSIKCQKMRLTDFHGISFGVVTGDFRCGSNMLASDSLIHFPRVIGKNLTCYKNKLTTLIDGPISVRLDYDVKDNKLESLQGLAQDILSLNCSGNKLTSLDGCPSEMHSINCDKNKINTFKGAPKKLKILIAPNNQLKDFDGFDDKEYGIIGLFNNQISSFSGMTLSSYPSIRSIALSDNSLTTLDGMPDFPNAQIVLPEGIQSIEKAGEIHTLRIMPKGGFGLDLLNVCFGNPASVEDALDKNTKLFVPLLLRKLRSQPEEILKIIKNKPKLINKAYPYISDETKIKIVQDIYGAFRENPGLFVDMNLSPEIFDDVNRFAMSQGSDESTSKTLDNLSDLTSGGLFNDL